MGQTQPNCCDFFASINEGCLKYLCCPAICCEKCLNSNFCFDVCLCICSPLPGCEQKNRWCPSRKDRHYDSNECFGNQPLFLCNCCFYYFPCCCLCWCGCCCANYDYLEGEFTKGCCNGQWHYQSKCFNIICCCCACESSPSLSINAEYSRCCFSPFKIIPSFDKEAWFLERKPKIKCCYSTNVVSD